MNNTYCRDFNAVRQRFEGWWDRRDIGRPLMRLTAPKPGVSGAAPTAATLEQRYTDPEYLTAAVRYELEHILLLGDAFPNASCNLGPGSMALYLGSEPRFAEDTVWFTETVEDAEAFAKLSFDHENKWWVRHQEILRKMVELSDGDYLVCIPDIIENADILSSLRGAQDLCYDKIDCPENVEAGIRRIDELYFRYYDALRDIAADADGTVAYTAFQILGPERIAKIQCDYSALISPGMYREIIVPSLRKQCQNLRHSMYHLDGPDAIKHVDALMTIEELDALQWTCGAGQPDGACERWFPIYDKVRDAGKSLWIQIYDGGPGEWEAGTRRIIRRYGRHGLYFHYPLFPSAKEAEDFMLKFEG